MVGERGTHRSGGRYPGLVAHARNFRPWVLAIIALCIAAAAGGVSVESPTNVAERPPDEAVAVLSPMADVAVLPARPVDEVRVATSSGTSRVVVLSAILAALCGVSMLMQFASPPSGRGRGPLRARRYAIALRAPPAPFTI